ncbi:hypothetical protein PR202_gb13685 [Eleusine coracana subsp. coracana]|uniref:Uncharacterized protein n=1 Tax=Eleusine coracana subsp. coracana TaxID=191504 RepID=A0AAV5ETT1_ELECO|nr:hypothetical protein PR202_gb13685 [Eleusine coracana subsp. coracana]
MGRITNISSLVEVAVADKNRLAPIDPEELHHLLALGGVDGSGRPLTGATPPALQIPDLCSSSTDTNVEDCSSSQAGIRPPPTS